MQNNTNLASISLDNLDHVTGGHYDTDPVSPPDDSGVGVLSPAPPAPSAPQSCPQQSKPAPHGNPPWWRKWLPF